MTGIHSSPENTNDGGESDASVIAEEDLLRANCYGLLSSLLLAPPGGALLDTLNDLNGDDSPFGAAMTALGDLARSTKAEDVEDEFTRLFYGHGAGGELHPYASFYLTGFVYDKPLALLRNDLIALGLAKSDVTSEPEDHIAFLMNVMHDLIVGAHGAPMDLGVQKAFYDKHLAPWARAFFENLETAENAMFFRPVGVIGKMLMDIENQAFSIAA